MFLSSGLIIIKEKVHFSTKSNQGCRKMSDSQTGKGGTR